MDSAQHCLDQSAECRRLIQLARSEAEAYALKLLARSWSGLAGQIDRYNALVRQPPRCPEILPGKPARAGAALVGHTSRLFTNCTVPPQYRAKSAEGKGAAPILQGSAGGPMRELDALAFPPAIRTDVAGGRPTVGGLFIPRS
jgi:hypothetical protein